MFFNLEPQLGTQVSHTGIYLGIDSEPVNHGWLCDKGRFSYEAVDHDERLGSPMVRGEGDRLAETDEEGERSPDASPSLMQMMLSVEQSLFVRGNDVDFGASLFDAVRCQHSPRLRC